MNPTVIIGGADGPTSIFVAQSESVFNLVGLVIIILLMIPNILYAIRHQGEKNLCTSWVMNIMEQIGRYGCMLFMVVNIGFGAMSITTLVDFYAYYIGCAALLLLYYVFFIIYAKKPSMPFALFLAIIPTAIFAVCATALDHWLLRAFTIIFGVAHIYITHVNARLKFR